MKYFAFTALIVALLNLSVLAQATSDQGPDQVTTDLAELERTASEKLPPELLEAGRKGNEELRRSGILERALNVGGQMPEFELKDANGQVVDSASLLEQGPIVLVFYRGAWCPYCNLYLRGLQRRLTDFRRLGANLVAISVEPPDRSLKVLRDNKLEFTVLSDPDLLVARKFRIVYRLPDVVNDAVLARGFDIAKYNGSDEAELPLGATYVVNRTGKIEYAFLEVDYKKRADPVEIIGVLERLKK